MSVKAPILCLYDHDGDPDNRPVCIPLGAPLNQIYSILSTEECSFSPQTAGRAHSPLSFKMICLALSLILY